MSKKKLNREISLIYDLLFGYTEKLKRLRLELDPEEYNLPVEMAMVIKIDDYMVVTKKMSQFRKKEIIGKLEVLIKQLAGKVSTDILLAPIEDDTFILFLNPLFKDDKEFKFKIVCFAKKLKNELEKRTKLTFTIGIGRRYSNIKGLILSYQEALNSCRNAYFRGEEVFHIDDLILFKEEIPIFVANKKEKLLIQIRAKKFNTITEQFADVMNSIIDDGREPDIIKVRISNLFKEIINEAGLNDNYLFSVEKILEVKTKAELEELTRKLFAEIIINLKSKDNKVMLKKVIPYLGKNYSHKITLEEVSERAGLSIFYFSHLFKKEMGDSFITYLNKLRIKKAKELLLESNFNIAEICYQVGFSDPNYFTRVFKEYEKLTPSNYRKHG